ncbi:MAG: MFS transporter, partial [Niveispirillum sp.]|nr:MFS transporter [Niveispirillum sp.]
IRDMLHNRAWLVVFGFASLNFIRFGAVLSVTAYFAINILKQPWMISILLPAVSGTLLIGSAIAPPFLKKLGMRTGNRVALAAALLLYGVLPFTEAVPALFLTVYILSSILISISMTAIFAMAAEVVDYHEAQFGTRNEGLLAAGVNLSIKIGMALGGAIVAFGLAQAGYDPANVGDDARRMVHILYYAPAMLAIAAQIVCIGFWPERRG